MPYFVAKRNNNQFFFGATFSTKNRKTNLHEGRCSTPTYTHIHIHTLTHIQQGFRYHKYLKCKQHGIYISCKYFNTPKMIQKT